MGKTIFHRGNRVFQIGKRENHVFLESPGDFRRKNFPEEETILGDLSSQKVFCFPGGLKFEKLFRIFVTRKSSGLLYLPGGVYPIGLADLSDFHKP